MTEALTPGRRRRLSRGAMTLFVLLVHVALGFSSRQGLRVAARWRWRRAGLWAAVVLVAGLALAIGAGALVAAAANRRSLYQRTLAVAGQYRCPVCASESAAVSNAAEAVEMRSLIQGWLKQGDSQAQIRHFLVADYGTSILEKPPATGLNTLVWALPAAAGPSAWPGSALRSPAGAA